MRLLSAFSLILVFLGSLGLASALEDAPKSLRVFAKSTFSKLSTHPTFVATVRKSNAEKTTLDEIKKIDKAWSETIGYSALMKELLSNESAKSLDEYVKKHPYIAEAFLTNALGANVAMTEKTSDYWQGDEDKFQKSFKTGSIVVGEIKYDSSALTYTSHVSIPIRNETKKVIGVLILGIDIDAFESRRK